MTTIQRDTERLYLDYAATWPMRPEVWEAMGAELRHGFNPASAHRPGRRAHRCLELARGRIGELLGCERSCLFFTGGGTQSDNLAILGFVRSHQDLSPRVFVSEIEHKACLEAAERGEAEGARAYRIPVDGSGALDLEWLRRELEADPAAPTLISVMWANNEIGTVQSMDDIVALGHEYGALVHTDAVQALGKVEVDLERTPVDLLSATAHKLGGPVGIGLLYRRPGVTLEPLSYGGGQERSMWPGTQNPIGATGFATALALVIGDRESEVARWTALRDHLEARLIAEIPDARIHGREAPLRLPNLVSVGIPGCDSGAVLVSLDFEGIAASGGSACGSDSSVGSGVLDAIGIAGDAPYAAVRFSFGHETSLADIDRAADAIARVAARVLALTA
ncbi:cysteine desulfurase family protein [Candidatus Palauibacter sp.]|uniref:cysteine desulfurase family protein n=1 Tax=Candidatus Palauibacter sp. TaxID=3101350 RepID=UPI003AF28FEA